MTLELFRRAIKRKWYSNSPWSTRQENEMMASKMYHFSLLTVWKKKKTNTSPQFACWTITSNRVYDPATDTEYVGKVDSSKTA
jgi:hypothetical protein